VAQGAGPCQTHTLKPGVVGWCSGPRSRTLPNTDKEAGCCWVVQWPKVLNAPLEEVDPELYDIIEHEKNRQWKVRGAGRVVMGRLCVELYCN
jgi:hypothetical protein